MGLALSDSWVLRPGISRFLAPMLTWIIENNHLYVIVWYPSGSNQNIFSFFPPSFLPSFLILHFSSSAPFSLSSCFPPSSFLSAGLSWWGKNLALWTCQIFILFLCLTKVIWKKKTHFKHCCFRNTGSIIPLGIWSYKTSGEVKD